MTRAHKLLPHNECDSPRQCQQTSQAEQTNCREPEHNARAHPSKAGLHLCGFLTPPVAGADLRAALVASCLRGALPPVDLRAVCFVRAMAAVHTEA